MTTAVQHRRGTTAEHSTFTGLEGEVTIDTTKDTAVIHDGVLAGGYPLAKETLANVNPSSLTAITGAATASDDLFMVYDASTTSMKKITRAELNNAMEADALSNVSITGGTINGTTIGGTTAAAGSFTTLSASDAVTISAGTANGVAYLNGSKVLTTGSALTFDGTTLATTGALTVSGNTTLGDASTDTVTVNGYMGVGGAGSSNVSINAVSSALTGTVQYGVVGNITGTSGATSQINAVYAGVKTAAATFTVSAVAGYRVDDAVKGAGSTITNQHGLYIADQTQGTNNYGITSLVSSGSNKWNIYASGTAANYFAGNVGIGTSSPGALVHVNVGGVSATSGGYRLGQSGWSSQYGYWEFDTVNSRFKLGVNGATQPLTFDTNNTERLRITSSGSVGIGTTAPEARTSIVSAAQDTPALILTPPLGAAAENYTAIQGKYSVGNEYCKSEIRFGITNTGSGTGHLAFATGTNTATERLRLDSSGNLGLGVKPSGWSGYKAIEVGYGTSNAAFAGAANDLAITSNAYYNAGWKYITSSVLASEYRQTSGQHIWYTAPSGTAGTAISFTQAMTLDASGNLLVGRTNIITFSANNSDGVVLQSSRIDVSAASVARITQIRDASGTLDRFYNGASIVGSITCTTSATTYATSSDYRLKDNIQDITGSGAFIDALQPRSWNWKVDGSAGAGFIAHELQAVSPSSVVGEKDAVDADGNPEYQAVEYGSAEVIAMLVAEVKSLRARLTAAGL